LLTGSTPARVSNRPVAWPAAPSPRSCTSSAAPRPTGRGWTGRAP